MAHVEAAAQKNSWPFLILISIEISQETLGGFARSEKRMCL